MRDFMRRKTKEQLEWFLAHPEYHQLNLLQLTKLTGLKRETIIEHLLPAIGRKPPTHVIKQQNKALQADKDFGTPGERAPCSHVALAKRHGVPVERVSALRRRFAIRPFHKSYDPAYRRKPAPPNAPRRPQFSRKQRWGFALLDKWKRNTKAMDKHLEMLRDNAAKV